MFLGDRMTLGACINFIRTWSAFHGWQKKHAQSKKREDGGSGDVIDQMFDAMIKSEPAWQNVPDWKDMDINLECGSGLSLAQDADKIIHPTIF